MITAHEQVFIVVTANACYLGLWLDSLRFRRYYRNPKTRTKQ